MNEKVIDELVVLISQSKRATSFSGGGLSTYAKVGAG